MFIVILTYLKSLNEVMDFLSEHDIYLDKYFKNKIFIASGRQNPCTGGIIICNAKNRSEVQSIIEEDPFFTNGIAKYDIIEFEVMKHSEAFKQILA